MRIEPALDAYGLGATFFWLLVGPERYGTVRLPRLPDVRSMADVTARLIARLVDVDAAKRPPTEEVHLQLERIGARLGAFRASQGA